MGRYLLLLGVLAFSVGCADQYPPYAVAILAEDPGLIGVWAAVEEDGEESDDHTRLEFLSRQVPFDGERLATGTGSGGLLARKLPTLEQFTVRMTDDDEMDLEFAGYLLAAGDVRLLGLQLDREDEAIPLVLPVHLVFRLDRDGDELSLTLPQAFVVWMPEIEPVDGPEDPAAPIEWRESEGGMFRVTSSIDRLAAYYAAHAEEPDFWDEEVMRLKRVEDGDSKPVDE